MTSQNIAILSLALELTEAVGANTFVDLSGKTAAPGGYAHGVAATNGDMRGVEGVRDTVAVAVLGTAQVLAGGAIAKGRAVEVGPGGRAVALDEGVMVGRALQAAGADGDLVEIFLIPS
jgi:hypothetical protein